MKILITITLKQQFPPHREIATVDFRFEKPAGFLYDFKGIEHTITFASLH